VSTLRRVVDNNHRAMQMREVFCVALSSVRTELEMDRSSHQESYQMPTESLLHQD